MSPARSTRAPTPRPKAPAGIAPGPPPPRPRFRGRRPQARARRALEIVRRLRARYPETRLPLRHRNPLQLLDRDDVVRAVDGRAGQPGHPRPVQAVPNGRRLRRGAHERARDVRPQHRILPREGARDPAGDARARRPVRGPRAAHAGGAGAAARRGAQDRERGAERVRGAGDRGRHARAAPVAAPGAHRARRPGQDRAGPDAAHPARRMERVLAQADLSRPGDLLRPAAAVPDLPAAGSSARRAGTAGCRRGWRPRGAASPRARTGGRGRAPNGAHARERDRERPARRPDGARHGRREPLEHRLGRGARVLARGRPGRLHLSGPAPGEGRPRAGRDAAGLARAALRCRAGRGARGPGRIDPRADRRRSTPSSTASRSPNGKTSGARSSRPPGPASRSRSR